MIRVSGLRLPPDADPDQVRRAAARTLGVGVHRLGTWRLVRRSVDARRGSLAVVWTIDLEVPDEEAVLRRAGPGVARTPDARYRPPQPGAAPLPHRPVIVGTGPAGLFAGLLLAEAGFRPILLERGDPVEDRVRAVARFWASGDLDPESNVQFGEGGAGTFSDGKLTTRIQDPRCAFVLEAMVQAGAPAEIAWSWQPHVGTDRLREVVRHLRERLLRLGAEVRFRHRVTDLVVAEDRIQGVVVGGGEAIPCEALVLAPGHSARDTFEMLARRGVDLQPKPFAVGARIEHLQETIDAARWHRWAGHPALGPASYHLAWQAPSGRGCYTFCMCPGGQVVAACSEPGGVVTNGMSLHARNGRNGNAALVVQVWLEDFQEPSWQGAVDFQRRLERAALDLGGGDHRAPAQRVGDFLAHRPSTSFGRVHPTFSRGVRPSSLDEVLPEWVSAHLRQAIPALDRQMPGFGDPDAVLTAVETRTSSPVRIPRDTEGESSLRGLFPAGEGAGWAGGIVSAAVDGIRVAETILRRFRPT